MMTFLKVGNLRVRKQNIIGTNVISTGTDRRLEIKTKTGPCYSFCESSNTINFNQVINELSNL